MVSVWSVWDSQWLLLMICVTDECRRPSDLDSETVAPRWLVNVHTPSPLHRLFLSFLCQPQLSLLLLLRLLSLFTLSVAHTHLATSLLQKEARHIFNNWVHFVRHTISSCRTLRAASWRMLCHHHRSFPCIFPQNSMRTSKCTKWSIGEPPSSTRTWENKRLRGEKFRQVGCLANATVDHFLESFSRDQRSILRADASEGHLVTGKKTCLRGDVDSRWTWTDYYTYCSSQQIILFVPSKNLFAIMPGFRFL